MTKSLGGSSALSALAASTVVSGTGSGSNHGKGTENGGMVDMSKSLASFHLSASSGDKANISAPGKFETLPARDEKLLSVGKLNWIINDTK